MNGAARGSACASLAHTTTPLPHFLLPPSYSQAIKSPFSIPYPSSFLFSALTHPVGTSLLLRAPGLPSSHSRAHRGSLFSLTTRSLSLSFSLSLSLTLSLCLSLSLSRSLAHSSSNFLSQKSVDVRKWRRSDQPWPWCARASSRPRRGSAVQRAQREEQRRPSQPPTPVSIILRTRHTHSPSAARKSAAVVHIASCQGENSGTHFAHAQVERKTDREGGRDK